MQKVNQTESSQDIEMREAQTVSPDSMVREDPSSEAISPPNGWRCYWKKCTFLAMLLLCSLMLGYQVNTQKTQRQVDGQMVVDEYDFMVFCPATDDDLLSLTKSSSEQPKTDLRRRLLGASTYSIELDETEKAKYLSGRTYVVRTQSRVDSGKLVLQYCGRMKYFDEDCLKAIDRCADSPMFDIPNRQSVDIIWVNNLDPKTTFNAGSDCVSPTSDNHHCTLMAKVNSTRTFEDPTTHTSSPTGDDTMRISYQSWPISTHVHGAQVRPAFDGNPLSWITNNEKLRKFGVGTFSLHETCYFNSFQQSTDPKLATDPPKFRLIGQDNVEKFNFKVNRYPNHQNPGTLWYHDHAMRLTNFNVKYGLAGFYILRDFNVQNYLGVDRSNQKFILITSATTTYKLLGLYTDTVYRFRFLNGNYEGRMTFRYYFSYGECDDNPVNMESFTMIGADSSLFAYGIQDQTQFVLSNGERVDLLIKFAAGKRQFSICADTKTSIIQPKVKSYSIPSIPLQTKTKDLNARSSIKNIDLSKWVAYTDLSKIPDYQIAVKRMRPLLFYPGPFFAIHGRTDFHKGWSENPMIGSVEDWYMINVMSGAHPMHIHLVNFQVVKVYHLKMFDAATTYYEMDFILKAMGGVKPGEDSQVDQFRKSIYPTPYETNYAYVSANLAALKSNKAILKFLNLIYPENEVDPQRVSGLNLFKRDIKGAYEYIIGEGRPPTKPEQKNWKDTANVEGFQAFQLRVRWAKPDYNEAKDKATGNFFHIPADQMREYPGFVYHCHILPHEDNEMMRPIMLQMPKEALSSSAPCNYLNWADKVQCINRNCGNK